MFKNYLIVTFRNLLRSRTFSLINIVGFALGLIVFLIIGLYVVDDLSYDRMHQNADRIYRLLTVDSGSNQTYAVTSGALTRALPGGIPEVEATTRVFNFGSIDLSILGVEGQAGIQRRVLGTDSSFFKVFDFELIEGKRNEQLRAPTDVAISDEVAHAMFGDEPAIGKTIEVPGQPTVMVTGVFRKPPVNSHLQFDVLVPAIPNDQNRIWWESWDNVAGYGYLRASEGSNQKELEQKIVQFARKNGFAELYRPELQPLLDIHLGSNNLVFDFLNSNKNDKTRILILSVIALMTLLIASINFINLSSARAMKRAREVGMRKVVGANRTQLIGQFLGESVILTLISLVIAAGTVQLVLPKLTGFLGKQLAYSVFSNPTLLFALIGSTILVGLLAGIYPALVLSSFKPVSVLKGNFKSSGHGIAFRRVLVVAQFAISIALISSVLLVNQQLHYVMNMNLGYNIDQQYALFTFNDEVARSRDALISRLQNTTGVLKVGSANYLPGNTPARYDVLPEGKSDDKDAQTFNRLQVGPGFIDVYDIQIVDGRGFSVEYADSDKSVILNETGVRALGMTDPVGQTIYLGNTSGGHDPRTIVGIVRDFHLASAHSMVSPLVLEYLPHGGGVVTVKLAAGDIQPALKRVRAVWDDMFKDVNENGVFVDRAFRRQYNEDRNFSQKVSIFTILAILIASLGLLGLTAYSTEQRKREIAVRKVLGSGEMRLLRLLTSDIIRWVLIANVIAWPLAWLAMTRWLDTFVYRISISLWPFIGAGIAAMVIALATVSLLTVRATRINPVAALRQE